MAYTKKTEIHDAAQGSWIELGTFTLDPASVAAASQGIETVTITGLKTGDLAFINAEAIETMLMPVGCKVTATDTLSVYLNNAYDSSTAVNGGSKTYSVLIVHMS